MINPDSTIKNIGKKYADDARGEDEIDYNIATESGSGSKGDMALKDSPSGQDLTLDML
jgi:hypothetical protein